MTRTGNSVRVRRCRPASEVAMHPRLLLVAASVAVCLVFASSAPAARITDRASLTRHGKVAFGEPISARVNVHTRFASIRRVCFFLTFEDDLVDPGEEWSVKFDANVGEFGLLNTSENPVSGVSLCLVPFQSAMMDRFLDGREELAVTMETPGSMRVAKLVVRVRGVRK